MRQKLGEFVGNVFYGTLIRQMHASTLKGKYMHGGRGEEVFQAQLGMELAQTLGRAANDPIADRLYESWMRQREKSGQETLKKGQEPFLHRRPGGENTGETPVP